MFDKMTQETKDKLEQVAQRKWEEDQATNPTPVNPHAYVYGFKAGAQTILDNPQEWFPPVQYWQLRDENERLQSQLTRYREVLEKIANDSGCHLTECIRIAKEALKQQNDENRN